MQIGFNIIWKIIVVLALMILIASFVITPISGQGLPDLVIADITCDLAADEITYTVKNIGNSTANSGFVVQYIPLSGYALYNVFPNPLDPGEQYEGTFNLANEGIDLLYDTEVRICVDVCDNADYDNLIAESNETNNCLQKTCGSVIEPPSPESEVWCLADGKVELMTAATCEQRGGTTYSTQEQALAALEGAVEQPSPESEVWCLADGKVELMTAATCEQRGGTMYSTQEQALAALEEAVEVTNDTSGPAMNTGRDSEGEAIIREESSSGSTIFLPIILIGIAGVLLIIILAVYLWVRKKRAED